MSLEDHKLATIMDNVKTQTVPIVDIEYIEYIDYQLKKQGLGQEDAAKIRDRKRQRLLQRYTTQNEAILT
eukprot:3615325-Amphidinium_carterae.1